MLASTYRSGSCVMRTEDNQKCNLANAVPWQLVSSVHSTRPEQERTDEMQAQECDLELRSESKRHQLNAFSLAKVVLTRRDPACLSVLRNPRRWASMNM